jgi:hypothetical protein
MDGEVRDLTEGRWQAAIPGRQWYGRLNPRIQPAVRALESRKVDLEAEITAARAELDRIIDALDQLALTEEEPHGQADTAEAPGPSRAGGDQQGPDEGVQGARVEQDPAAHPEAGVSEPKEVGPTPC